MVNSTYYKWQILGCLAVSWTIGVECIRRPRRKMKTLAHTRPGFCHERAYSQDKTRPYERPLSYAQPMPLVAEAGLNSCLYWWWRLQRSLYTRSSVCETITLHSDCCCCKWQILWRVSFLHCAMWCETAQLHKSTYATFAPTWQWDVWEHQFQNLKPL